MILPRKLLLCLLLFMVSYSSIAWWGLTGHRVVGEIAQSYLSAKARKAIKEIMGDESLAMAANWGDFVKSDSNYNYLNSWHYNNLKAGMTYNELEAQLLSDTGANLFARTNFLIAQLKNKELDKEKKLVYLRLLIHFIGDMHQPLHVGGRAENLGGNRIRVHWFNEATNIHTVWDERLLEFQQLSYTEWAKAINHTTKKQRNEWQQQPMVAWCFESYQIAQEIYAGITQTDQKLGYNYNFEHIDEVNQRLLRGGVRLAGVLNEIFG